MSFSPLHCPFCESKIVPIISAVTGKYITFSCYCNNKRNPKYYQLNDICGNLLRFAIIISDYDWEEGRLTIRKNTMTIKTVEARAPTVEEILNPYLFVEKFKYLLIFL